MRTHLHRDPRWLILGVWRYETCARCDAVRLTRVHHGGHSPVERGWHTLLVDEHGRRLHGSSGWQTGTGLVKPTIGSDRPPRPPRPGTVRTVRSDPGLRTYGVSERVQQAVRLPMAAGPMTAADSAVLAAARADLAAPVDPERWDSYVVQYRVDDGSPWADLPDPRRRNRAQTFATFEQALAHATALADRRQPGSTVRYRVAGIRFETDSVTLSTSPKEPHA